MTTLTNRTCRFSPQRSVGVQRHDTIEQLLLERLQRLPLSVFLRLVADLLRLLGYKQVRLLDRQHLRGRRSDGGIEISALTGTRMTPFKVIAAVKHVKHTIHRRDLDQLVGVSVRQEARYGFLITTSRFSATAMAVAEASSTVPLRLIDGPELMRLLVRHRLGVTEQMAPLLSLDEPYFDRLERRARRV